MSGNTKRKDAGNFAWVAIGELIGRVFQFFYLKLLTTAIGTENFGVISFAQSNVSFFVLFATLGLDSYGIREIAKNKENASSLINSILTLRLLLSLLAYGVLFAYISISLQSEFVQIITLIIGLRIFAESLHISWVFQGLEDFKVSALRNTAMYFFSFAGIYALVSSPSHTTLAVIILTSVMISVSLAQIIYYILKIDPVKVSINFARWKRILKQSTPIGISAFFFIVYNNSDIIMLGYLRSDEEVGLYAAASKLFLIAILPAMLIQQIFYPKLSKFGKPKESITVLSKYIQILLSLATFISGLFYLYSKELILLQFHQSFLAAVPILEIMSLKIFFSFVVIILTTSLLAWSRQNLVMWAVGFSALVNVLLNYLLIPKYGTMGAAWTSLGSELIVIMILGFVMLKLLGHSLLYQIFKPISLGIISVASSFFAFNFFENAIISSLISILVFLILLIISKIISYQDLMEIISKKGK